MKTKARTAFALNLILFLFGTYKTIELVGANLWAFYFALIGSMIFLGLAIAVLVYHKKHFFQG